MNRMDWKSENEVHFRQEYTDQKIPARGESVSEENLPVQIRKMKALYQAAPGFSQSGSAKFFYLQGKYMADYEDTAVYEGEYKRYYPTYHYMNDRQLRGYFGWRTRWRRGDLSVSVPASFVYLYIYELLDNIGVDPVEGLDQLKKTDRIFGSVFPGMHETLSGWIRDYLVYYDLRTPDVPVYFDTCRDENLSFLKSFEKGEITEPEISPGKMMEALEHFSAYHIVNTPFSRTFQEDAAAVYLRVYRNLDEMIRKRSHRTLSEYCLGPVRERVYRIFERAVFYDFKKYHYYEYEVTPVRKYICRDGIWYAAGDFSSGKSEGLGKLLHETERQMRAQFGFRQQLKPRLQDTLLVEEIRKTVAAYLEEKREAQKPRVVLDLSRLAGIRRDADLTRDSLIIENEDADESRRDTEYTESAEPGNDPEYMGSAEPGNDTEYTESDKSRPDLEYTGLETESATVLPDPEYRESAGQEDDFSEDVRVLLYCLLYDRPWKEYFRKKQWMVTITADKANEELMDRIGDTVIEFDGEEPAVVEDYRADLEKIIPEAGV